MSDNPSRWLFAAMLAPLLHSASGAAWPIVLLAGLGCILLSILARKEQPRWVKIAMCVWTVPFMLRILDQSAQCWPDSTGNWIMPLILLALAVWAVWDGAQAASRAGLILRWFVLVIVFGILLSGIKEVHPAYLLEMHPTVPYELIPVLLLPMLDSRGVGDRLRLTGTAVGFAVAASAVTIGVLSIGYASAAEMPFYELSRSLTFFGTAKRFESLASAALTIGYFLLLSYLLAAWRGNRKNVVIAASAVAALYLLNIEISNELFAVGTVLVWAFLPCAAPEITKLKNKEKKG